jgi:biotin carboxylase
MKSTTHKLMIVGATWEQIPLIETAKELGHWVIATDSNPLSEGLLLADAYEIVDPLDLPAIYELAIRYGVDGITADECDYSHYAATFVSSRLNLPNDGLDAAQFTTNKRWMRERCREARISQPRFFTCRTLKEAQKAVQVIDWPVVVKPVDNRGSIGVSVVHSDTELPAAYLDAVMNAHSHEVLVEAYVDGTHITVDGCFDRDGKHHNLAVASKKIIPGAKPVIIEVIYPAEISGQQLELVLDTNDAVVAALNMEAGLSHSEYIIDKQDRVFLLETANRGGGVLTSAKIIPEVSGVDASRLLISNALDQKYEIRPHTLDGMVMLTFLVLAPGEVKGIRGVENARELENVMELRLNFDLGDTLVPPISGAARHGFVIMKGNSRAELQSVYDEVMTTIEIDYA